MHAPVQRQRPSRSTPRPTPDAPGWISSLEPRPSAVRVTKQRGSDPCVEIVRTGGESDERVAAFAVSSPPLLNGFGCSCGDAAHSGGERIFVAGEGDEGGAAERPLHLVEAEVTACHPEVLRADVEIAALGVARWLDTPR
jgi:hypothetical protein